MKTDIRLNIAVEDQLSEAVVRRLLAVSGRPFHVVACFQRGGKGYLKSKIGSFNQAARHFPWMVLADLDSVECAPDLLKEWLPGGCSRNLLFRVACREVESWLMADREGFAGFLGMRPAKIPINTDAIDDPKRLLIQLVGKCRASSLKADILPPPSYSVSVGPNYNLRLSEFVKGEWSVDRARMHSDSLDRACSAIANF